MCKCKTCIELCTNICSLSGKSNDLQTQMIFNYNHSSIVFVRDNKLSNITCVGDLIEFN